MSEESDLVAKIITNDINTLVEDLNNVIKAHNVLVEENQQLKDRINKAIEYIQRKEYQYGDEEQDLYDYDIGFDEVNELLEILKGDKE